MSALSHLTRTLNDVFRQTFVGGRVVLTQGVEAFAPTIKNRVLTEVRFFKDFDTDNDPHGEHDFGAFTVGQYDLFWKIDYYNKTMDGGSEDPSNSRITMRVLTIMLREEY